MEDPVHYIDLIRLSQYERRIFQDRANPMELYDEEKFRIRFRLSKETIRDFVMPKIIGELSNPTRRNRSLTAIQQLCITLRYYACGSYHRVVADTIGVHYSTVSKVIRRVSIIIIRRLKLEYVTFPVETSELLEISNGFAEKCVFS